MRFYGPIEHDYQRAQRENRILKAIEDGNACGYGAESVALLRAASQMNEQLLRLLNDGLIPRSVVSDLAPFRQNLEIAIAKFKNSTNNL